MELSSATETKLNSIQVWFLRLTLQVGQGSPVAAVLWDTSLLDMGLRVKREKVLLIIHLRSLEENALARVIYEKQKEKEWAGLVKETIDICKYLDIEDCNITKLNKNQYSIVLNKACHKKNEEIIRLLASSIKCDRMKKEDYGRKEYIKNQTIQSTREWFRTRFGLLPFAGNYSHNRRFEKSNWLCRCKTSREEEGHIVSGQCESYGDLRIQFGDLGEDENLVAFFKAVLRQELEDEDGM